VTTFVRASKQSVDEQFGEDGSHSERVLHPADDAIIGHLQHATKGDLDLALDAEADGLLVHNTRAYSVLWGKTTAKC